MDLFGLPVFEGLGIGQFLAVLCSYALAFTIKGLFGYGAVPPIVLMGSLVMPPHHAVILAGLVNVATQGFLIRDGLQNGNYRLAGRMILFIVPALVVGVAVFQRLQPDALQVTVGALLLGILLAEGTSWRERILPFVEARFRFFSAMAAMIAGLMAGVVGAGSMIFLSVYLRTVEADRLSFRGTIILIVTAMLVWRTTLLVAAGLVSWSLVLEAILILPLALLFLHLGRSLAHSLTNDAFFRVYRIVMIAAALLLIVRGAI